MCRKIKQIVLYPQHFIDILHYIYITLKIYVAKMQARYTQNIIRTGTLFYMS